MLTRDVVTDSWRFPPTPEGDAVIFNEPGRVLDLKHKGGNYDVDYKSHCLSVTKGQFGGHWLRVHHGGGNETWKLHDACIEGLAAMDSDARYFALYAIMEAHHDSERSTAGRITSRYNQAFVDGRIKKRKMRGTKSVRVWIEDAPRTTTTEDTAP